MRKMFRRFFSPITLLSILLFGFGACVPSNAETIEDNKDHVIILAFDGWGASSFEAANMPFLKSMLSESAWTLHKRSILPTSSACNWATMFKGAGPEAHGYIEWDTKKPVFGIAYADAKGNFPSLFSVYREAHPDHEMGYLYQWEGMFYLFDMSDFSFIKHFALSEVGSDAMKEASVAYIQEKKPTLALMAWDYPDHTGHTVGWYTDAYMKELSHIDSIIEEIVDACKAAGIYENTLFVITSDHGGHDKGHGQAVMSDLETPFIMFGKGVRPGEIQSPLMQYDVAAILADYLHLHHPDGWRGKTPEGLL